MAQVVRHLYHDDTRHDRFYWIAAVCFAILAAAVFYFAFSSKDAAAVESGLDIKEIVKNPEESGPARITHDNPKIAPTTGTDVQDRGYRCRTITLRRDDGGLTKVRRCAD